MTSAQVEDPNTVIEEVGSDGRASGVEAEPAAETLGEIKAPFDPAQIDVITQTRTVDLLLTRLREGEMNLSPEFQRRANLWNDVRKSSLVESMLLRIPIPSLYVSEDLAGNYTVVDGLQRMCAIAHFVEVKALNKAVIAKLQPLELRGLQSLPKDYEGKTFESLPRTLQRRISETELTLHVIRASTPPEVKFNIFSRINRGGLPLSAQEIRNAIYPGAWQRDTHELSQSKEFLVATGSSIRGERMEDIELILRFLAHYELGKNERPPDQNLDDFLNFYATKSNSFSEEKRKAANEAFLKAMRYAPKIFGKHAFRKYYVAGEPRKPINRGLFESQSVVLARMTEADLHRLSHNQPLVLQKVANLLNQDSEFENALLYATGRGSSSNVRIERLTAALEEVLDA